MGGGHNNSGNSVGVQQKSSMMDKLKNVFSSKKEVDQLIRIMKASILEAAEEYQDMKMAG